MSSHIRWRRCHFIEKRCPPIDHGKDVLDVVPELQSLQFRLHLDHFDPGDNFHDHIHVAGRPAGRQVWVVEQQR